MGNTDVCLAQNSGTEFRPQIWILAETHLSHAIAALDKVLLCKPYPERESGGLFGTCFWARFRKGHRVKNTILFNQDGPTEGNTFSFAWP